MFQTAYVESTALVAKALAKIVFFDARRPAEGQETSIEKTARRNYAAFQAFKEVITTPRPKAIRRTPGYL